MEWALQKRCPIGFHVMARCHFQDKRAHLYRHAGDERGRRHERVNVQAADRGGCGRRAGQQEVRVSEGGQGPRARARASSSTDAAAGGRAGQLTSYYHWAPYNKHTHLA